MQLRAFLLAVEDIAYEAIARTAKLFLRGEIKGHNRAFAPSCAEFADACRYQQASIEAERRPRIENKAKEDNSPRVAPWKLRLLNDALQGNVEARNELRKMFPHLSISEMADMPVENE